MTLLGVAVRNIRRSKLRTALTVTVVAIATLFFILLRTVVWSWTSASEFSAKDRIATRHKVSFVMTLPKRYAREIAEIPGVNAVAYCNWFGAKNPKDERDFFATIATDPKALLDVYHEIKVPPAEKQAWFENRRGALIGEALAKKEGWKVGDKVTLNGSIYPGNWEFFISGIYTTTTTNVDRSTFYFHWDYLNESLSERRKDHVGWILANINDAGASGRISKEIDARFGERDLQTVTMSEAALNQSFLGMFSAILKAVDIVSGVMIAIMGLIVGNTIAMGVRERTNEYGVLRAIGFLPKHIAQFVLGEAAAIGLIGGLLGITLSYPFVSVLVGRALEENMGNMFPQFRVQPGIALLSLALAIVLATATAFLPARQASSLKVVDALRRIG
jgi:putative ABC transport system permease protein